MRMGTYSILGLSWPVISAVDCCSFVQLSNDMFVSKVSYWAGCSCMLPINGSHPVRTLYCSCVAFHVRVSGLLDMKWDL